MFTCSMKNSRLLGLGFWLRSIACLPKHICTALSFNVNGHDIKDDECSSVAAVVSVDASASSCRDGKRDDTAPAASASSSSDEVAMRDNVACLLFSTL